MDTFQSLAKMIDIYVQIYNVPLNQVTVAKYAAKCLYSIALVKYVCLSIWLLP